MTADLFSGETCADCGYPGQPTGHAGCTAKARVEFRARRTDPEPSHEAARMVTGIEAEAPKLRGKVAMVYRDIYLHPGTTQDESFHRLAEFFKDRTGHSPIPASLRRRGLVYWGRWEKCDPESGVWCGTLYASCHSDFEKPTALARRAAMRRKGDSGGV